MAEDDLIPVRNWMREHYTKLIRTNKATCNYCNVEIKICVTHLVVFHRHLVNVHPEKLTEEEKKEVKFSWIWDHFIAKIDKEAICKHCQIIIKYEDTTRLKQHLKKHHNILGPNSYIIIHDESTSYSDANKDITLRNANQEDLPNSSNLANNLNECTKEAKALNEEAEDNVIPVRHWIRRHYTKLTTSLLQCNLCNKTLIMCIYCLDLLHRHLVVAHPDKLTAKNKNDVKFCWIWDHFTEKCCKEAICKHCKATIIYGHTIHLKEHLIIHHKISGPNSDCVIISDSSSDRDIDANDKI
ncbi:PREDICTED: uncharacterized protein LOC105151206 [Acromyrmex echinatior]|uniref:uncharacterized protein LOC105151206 n=1 Tax=Acromyrmex echinatior TaxID=103372 RepID=UPI000580FEF6|nr:PREDICTED: uncharacterized protein LOC105151206 [Acromyrmex echinatior]